MSLDRDERLHRKAVELIRRAYGVVDGMRNVNLEALNEPRPPTLRYHAQYELCNGVLTPKPAQCSTSLATSAS
jgi:hypothetical protein